MHPYSRKARQIARVVQRQEKLSNKKLSRQSTNNSKGRRDRKLTAYVWKDSFLTTWDSRAMVVVPLCIGWNGGTRHRRWNPRAHRSVSGIWKKDGYSSVFIYILTRYLKRNDEELEKLVKERQRSSHRTKKPREDVLVALKESEANEYASGLG